MSKKKQVKKIPCKHHSGYYSLVASDGIRLCAKCEKELNKYITEKKKEFGEYVDKKFREIGQKLEGIDNE